MVDRTRNNRRITLSSERILGSATRSGSYTTDPVDISSGKGWSVQFAVTGGTGQIQTQVSAGDENAWADLGAQVTLENGTLIQDDLAPYKLVRFVVTAAGTVEGSATFTMVL